MKGTDIDTNLIINILRCILWAGMIATGINPNEDLVEIVEIPVSSLVCACNFIQNIVAALKPTSAFCVVCCCGNGLCRSKIITKILNSSIMRGIFALLIKYE